MDNARIHYYSGVAELISELDLNVMYHPPYSPSLYPIENAFSKWKNFVARGNCLSDTELKERLLNGFGSITPENCAGFFRKMLRCLPRCLRKEEIFE